MSSAAPLPAHLAAEDKGPGIIATICVVTVLETLFCAARIYTRGRILGRLQLDDYLVVLSVIMGWASVAFSVMAVQSGNGKHFAILTTEQKSGAILWTMVGFCPGILSFGIPKLAVVALLSRLMNPSRIHKIFLWSLATVCLLSLLGCVVVLFGRCTPARSLWDFDVVPEGCFDVWILVNYAIYAGTFSAFTDLYLAVYPAIVLFSLRMNLRKKLALSGALGVGSIATVVAIYKTTRLPGLASPDFSYDTSDLVVWTAVEGATIIIAACIPVLQPFKNGSYGPSKDYAGRSGGHDGGIELSHTSHNRSKRPVKDPNSLTFLDETRAGSEESILKNGQQRPELPVVPEYESKSDMTLAEGSSIDGRDAHHAAAGGGGGGHALPPPSAGNAGIVRTTVVSVSYGQEAGGHGSSRWNARGPGAGMTGRAA
ncbi:hypothetical protein C8A03DRAFT_19421 [Achaetomium macrosporum]|uniref:Rhodopsin domain-containing protein n=1 Tax=Achaetomium macrosporum TaxID=79813 RepID=A0AAN7C1I4_9PEZI|nr:hypothetical protein C8A03DRAFT_19421 [Achaetomium macrosporum]